MVAPSLSASIFGGYNPCTRPSRFDDNDPPKRPCIARGDVEDERWGERVIVLQFPLRQTLTYPICTHVDFIRQRYERGEIVVRDPNPSPVFHSISTTINTTITKRRGFFRDWTNEHRNWRITATSETEGGVPQVSALQFHGYRLQGTGIRRHLASLKDEDISGKVARSMAKGARVGLRNRRRGERAKDILIAHQRQPWDLFKSQRIEGKKTGEKGSEAGVMKDSEVAFTNAQLTTAARGE
ncbi:hypothetical protein L218DRAFT_947663 [Marasmius fiardii PR-910]|nr:hypothetical protein L218DRAFT_947663 [Marasmius fiardii PR-910]